MSYLPKLLMDSSPLNELRNLLFDFSMGSGEYKENLYMRHENYMIWLEGTCMSTRTTALLQLTPEFLHRWLVNAFRCKYNSDFLGLAGFHLSVHKIAQNVPNIVLNVYFQSHLLFWVRIFPFLLLFFPCILGSTLNYSKPAVCWH